MKRVIEIVAVAALCAGLLIPPDVRAEPPAGVRIQPIATAPRLALRTSSSPAPNTRARLVADSLRAGVEHARTRAAERRALAALRPRRVALPAAQQAALDALRGAAPGPVQIEMRPDTKTPRLIRGAGLERAARARAGSDRASDTSRSFLRKQKALLRLDDPDRELVLERRVRDRLGRTQLRFGQRHAGLRVWPAERIVHLDPAGDVEAVDGASVATPSGVATEPSISSASAIADARAHVAGAAAAEIGPPELLYYTGAGATRLAWRVFVPATLSAQWWVIVDAGSGAVANAWNDAQDADFVGSGTGGLGGNESIHVWNEAAGEFYLVDTSKAMFDTGASNPPDPDTTVGGIVVLDARNQPPNDDPQSFPNLLHLTSSNGASPWTSAGGGGNVGDGVSALANLSRTYDYFLAVHGRNSLDGNGGSLLAVVRLGVNFRNAFFLSENNIMAFGDADEYAGALDVVGHELTHGVTHHSANLIYQNESGALNEAFSDIFGEMVEARAGGTNDWLLGTHLSEPIRSMVNPPAFGDPKLYSQLVHTNADSGGVHTNSGILNHCFYQLVEGLPNAIGRTKAQAIFYRALTAHLTASSQYIDARLAAVQSAEELIGTLGITAGDVQAVRDAFDLVQVFDGEGTDPPDPFPGTTGPDSTIFLFTNPNDLETTLWRQEDALGDAVNGDPISPTPVKPARPAVTGDGALALFVDAGEALCLLATDTSAEEVCDDTLSGTVSSVSVSPDGNLYGFVLVNPETLEPDNQIQIFDLRQPAGHDLITITVEAPVIDGGTLDTILFADAMDFSADNQLVLFDALTSVQFTGTGGADDVRVWAIYAVDLPTRQIFAVVPPTPGLDIGYPALAQTSDHHLVFDVVDNDTGEGTLFAGNLDNGDLDVVASGVDGFSIPSYTGDDAQVVYTDFDGETPSSYSLYAQQVAADRITPTGPRARWIFEGSFGVIYRRGDFVPEPGAGALGAVALAALIVRARRKRA